MGEREPRRLWVARGGLAVLDPVLFAGSHLIVNILLARWLSPEEYGAFAAAYSVFLLVLAVHGALFVEPMLVFGAGRFRSIFGLYFRRLLRLHTLVTIPLSLLLLGAGLAWGRIYASPVAGALRGVAIASVFMLSLWLVRRACFAQLRPGWAAAGGGGYAFLLIGGILTLNSYERLSPESTFIVMGASALVTTLGLVAFLSRNRLDKAAAVTINEVAREHWRVGKWDLAAVLPVWVTGNIYYLVLPLWLGLEGVGAFRAVVNVAMPAIQTLGALSLVLLPALAHRWYEGGQKDMIRPISQIVGLCILMCAAYFLMVMALWDDILMLLYAGRYDGYSESYALLVSIIPFGAGIHLIFAKALRAAERPDLVFRGHTAAALVALAVGTLLGWWMGVRGALFAMFLASLTGGLVMFVLYRRLGTAPKRVRRPETRIWGNPSTRRTEMDGPGNESRGAQQPPTAPGTKCFKGDIYD